METATPANVDLSSNDENTERGQAGVGTQERNFEWMDSVYYAAAEGDIHRFKQHDKPLDQLLTPNDNTILHIYITARPKRKSKEGRRPRENFVEDIFEMCPDLLWKANTKGETLLHMAAKHGHADIVNVLIAECKKPEQNDRENGVEASKLMLRKTNDAKDTALHEAVRYNQLDVVKILTKEDDDLSYDANNAGETPLYLAVERGYEDVMKNISFTCNSTADHGPKGRTALHAAVICNNKEMIKILLDKKGNLTSKADAVGWVPLHYAALFGYIDMLKELLYKDKSAAYRVDKKGRIALHIAAEYGKVKIMEELILRCPGCCELVDNRGWNVFHFALNSKNTKAVELLLKIPSVGNLINEKNAQGNTPLLQLAASTSYMGSFIRHPKVDKLAVNHQNRDTRGIIFETDLLERPQVLFLECLDFLKVGQSCRVITEDEGGERGGKCSIPSKKIDDEDENDRSDDIFSDFVRKTQSIHLIVATLIATVTFTAGMNLPGGYINEKGPDQGAAVLINSRAFQGFVILNTIAMLFSSCAVFIHLFLQRTEDSRRDLLLWKYSLYFTIQAMAAMVVAFIMGTYAALYPYKELAVSACVISSLFFLAFTCSRPHVLLFRRSLRNIIPRAFKK